MRNMINRRAISQFSMRAIAAALVLLGASACKNESNESELEAAKGDYVAERNFVDTMLLKKADFNLEIVSNGNLRAVKKANMVFKNSGMIEKVFKKNGDAVRKGDTIVTLDRKLLKMKLNQSQINMEKAELDFTDNLLGFGYGKDTANIDNFSFNGIRFLIGGIIYTLGGIIYALRVPAFDEKHKNFGSHDIFHLFVMGGSLCHFIFIYCFVL